MSTDLLKINRKPQIVHAMDSRQLTTSTMLVKLC